jgi:predicted anti-sigma-YlaC factor YlaD
MGGRTRAVSSQGWCGEVRQALAVYVLGAIGPADRDVVDRHLADCAGCRGELAGFAALPALLRRVSPQEMSALVDDDTRGSRRGDQPSGPVLRLLLGRAGRRRRRYLRTRVTAAAAVGLLAGAGVIAGWHAAHPAVPRPLAASPPGWSVTPRAADPQSRVSAIVRYAATVWGLQMSVQVTGIPAGTTCQVEVISATGQVTPAGGWTIARGPANWYPASSPVPPSGVRGFAVSSGSRILVTVPIRAHAGTTATPRSGWPGYAHGPAGRGIRL